MFWLFNNLILSTTSKSIYQTHIELVGHLSLYYSFNAIINDDSITLIFDDQQMGNYIYDFYEKFCEYTCLPSSPFASLSGYIPHFYITRYIHKDSSVVINIKFNTDSPYHGDLMRKQAKDILQQISQDNYSEKGFIRKIIDTLTNKIKTFWRNYIK